MSSVMRMSGLASGMDTQAMVDALMQAKRVPLDKMYQKKQLLEWKRDDYRDMNLLLKELDTYIFEGVFKQSNMVKKSVSSSNSDVVSATASAGASEVNYSIGNVTLATAARKESANKISNSQIDTSKSIWSQKDTLLNKDQFNWQQEEIKSSITVPKNGSIQFELSKYAVTDGDTISIGGTDLTIRTSSATPLKEDEVYIDTTTGKMKLGKALEPGKSYDIEYTSNYIEFDVKTYDENGKAQYQNFKFDGSTSLNNMFSTINKSTAGVNLFYDSGTDKVVAMRTETGNFNSVKDANGNEIGNEIEFLKVNRDADGKIVRDETTEEKSSFFQDVLGLGDDKAGTGTDAVFTINGLETTRKSNTFTINDVTFTLKKNTSSTDEATTISIKKDTDSIMKTITDFVGKYNEIIGKINGELSEKTNSNYAPLTDAEKEALSETQIEKWETLARNGMLRRDSILTSALNSMRTDLYTEVKSNDVTNTNPKYNQLAEIGISTTSNFSDRGKLQIDEDKLRAAIEDDPEAVFQMFMADGESYGEQGLARRMRETISNTMSSIEERAGNTFKTESSYTIGKQLLDYEDQIDRFEDRLADWEEQYWSKFTAMETAMQKLNSQSNTLLSYLGQGQ